MIPAGIHPLSIAAAKEHAIADYPREACGVIADGAYHRVSNIARSPHHDFEMPGDAWTKYGTVQAVLHSHIAAVHSREPSAADVARQQETAVPWGIIYAGPDSASDPLWFGNHLLDAPLLGRQFVFNVMDCWQLTRSYFWQTCDIKLKNPPCAPWWVNMGEDKFTEHVRDVGFLPIHPGEVGVGDFALMIIRGNIPNHCAVMAEPGILLHHLPERLSCRDSAHRWQKFIASWWRLSL